ncbi:MAG: PrsW family glutamic-type intramembrane protease [Acidobacteriota bacterium]
MKLRLMIQNGSLNGCQFELEQGSLLLGRGPDCAIRFDSTLDPGVSTRHAMIQAEPDGFYLIDQQSTNGTYSNANRIQRVLLRSGDMIQLGGQGPQIYVMVEGHFAPVYNSPPQPFIPPQQAFIPAPAPPMPPMPPPPPPPFTPLTGGSMGQQQASLPPSSPFNFTGTAGKTNLRQSMSSIGIYDPEKDKDKGNSYVSIGVALGIGAVMTLIVMLIVLLDLGLVGGIVGAIMAFTPAPLYLFLFLWLDRYDPEPAWALAGAFAWGGLFAVIVSYIINTFFGTVVSLVAGPAAGSLLGAVISAPVIEEGTKGLGVLLIAIFLRREFDDVLDGIVYAGVVALGFATVENVLYYGRAFLSGGGVALLFIGFLRGVLSPFAHTLFTSMTGIGCGIARETHNKTLRIVMPIVGYIGAVLLHGLWNLIASVSGGLGLMAFILIYFVVWVPLFLIFLGVMIYMLRREGRVIKEMLTVEVARGLITPAQLELIGSTMGRIKWLMSSLTSGNWKRLRAQRNFLRAVTKLAFCYWHVARAAAANNQTRSLTQIPKFQAEVMTLREQI